MTAERTDPTRGAPRAAEGEPKRLSEGELDTSRYIRQCIRPIPPECIDRLLAHAAALDAEIAALQQRLAEANNPEAVADRLAKMEEAIRRIVDAIPYRADSPGALANAIERARHLLRH